MVVLSICEKIEPICLSKKLGLYISNLSDCPYEDWDEHVTEEFIKSRRIAEINAELLYSCYISALDLALKHSVKSMAFPLISAGIYGYPLEKAWKTALKACKEWSEKHPNDNIQIIFTMPEQHKYDMGKEIMKQV